MKQYKDIVEEVYTKLEEYFKETNNEGYKEFRDTVSKPNFEDEELLEVIEKQEYWFTGSSAVILGCYTKNLEDVISCYGCPLEEDCYVIQETYSTLDDYIKSFKD